MMSQKNCQGWMVGVWDGNVGTHPTTRGGLTTSEIGWRNMWTAPKDNTRQLALRLASLGCLVVCIDRDGDTNQTTVNDIQVKPISEFQKIFFKTWLCPPGGWRYSLGISMRCEQEWRGGSDGEVRFFWQGEMSAGLFILFNFTIYGHICQRKCPYMGHMPAEKRLLRWQGDTRSSIPFQLPRCQGERCNRCCHSHFLNVSFSLSYCHENCNNINKILVNPMSTVHAGKQVIRKCEKYHQHVNIYVAITTI